MRGRKRLPNLDPERKSPCFASTDLSTLVPAPLSGADGTEAMGLGLPKPTRLSLSPSPRHGDSPFFLGPLRGGRAGLCRKHFTPWKSAPALSKDRALPWAVPRGLRGSHPRHSRPPSGTAAWVSSGSLKPRARCSLGAFGRAVASASPHGNALALPRSWPLLAVVQIWSELSPSRRPALAYRPTEFSGRALARTTILLVIHCLRLPRPSPG